VFSVQPRANVFVAESLHDMVPSQDGGEKAKFFCSPWVEASIASSMIALTLG
jgi:hypothetical protein